MNRLVGRRFTKHHGVFSIIQGYRENQVYLRLRLVKSKAINQNVMPVLEVKGATTEIADLNSQTCLRYVCLKHHNRSAAGLQMVYGGVCYK